MENPMKMLFDRTEGARVSDDLSVKDLRLVVMENDRVRVSVLVDKGADIVEFVDKRTGTDFLWRTANGIRSPKSEPNFLGATEAFNAYYEGGWQELFPHGSSPLDIHGVTLPRHGEVQALGWKYAIVKDTPEEVSVRFSVRTPVSPFVLERTMTMNASDPWVRFDERATNTGASDFDIMWGHHPAFGEPFLSGDCAIELPKGKPVDGDLSMCKINPKGRKGGHMWFLTGFAQGWYGIFNSKRKVGFGMKFDPKFFPVIWIWQGYSDSNFGRSYACAIEPFTSFAKNHYDIQGRVTVPAGATIATTFHAFAYGGKLAETLKRLG